MAIDGGGDGEGSVPRMMTAAPAALLQFVEQIKTMTGLDLESFLKDVLAQMAAVEKIEEAKVVEPPPPPRRKRRRNRRKQRKGFLAGEGASSPRRNTGNITEKHLKPGRKTAR